MDEGKGRMRKRRLVVPFDDYERSVVVNIHILTGRFAFQFPSGNIFTLKRFVWNVNSVDMSTYYSDNAQSR